MYAAKAFALKKVIRKILVEKLFQEDLSVTTDDGHELEGFQNWAAEVEHQINRMKDIHTDMGNNIERRQSIDIVQSGNENGGTVSS
jgi:hypothetical protein